MYKVSHSNWTLHVNNSCFSRVRPGLLSDAEQNSKISCLEMLKHLYFKQSDMRSPEGATLQKHLIK